ncbi:MAG TPA: hypothetical protein VLL54_03775 [Pyrinomonadaceae bacterium]|nr:hypothetical protein [Pyrinomonadaceae bacterium]
MHIQPTQFSFGRLASVAIVLLVVCSGSVSAQSVDVAWPSPVRATEVRATILARDIGDPRVTDHYYAFTGTPGDLLITVDTKNLNGDIDVFTFNGLRPLLKITVYAGLSSATTKSIYLRKEEDLILRVEGRTPNDDPATYRLFFGGSFKPITSGPLAEHEDANQSPEAAVTTSRGGRRVSSVGARIDEPPVEVAEAPKPEPTPDVAPVEPKVETPKPTRTNRPRRPVTRRTRPAEKPKPPAPVAKTDNTEKPAEDTGRPAAGTTNPVGQNSETEGHTTTLPKSRKARRTQTKPDESAAPTQEPEESGPRLLIETNDGTLVDRYMTTVRRVTVENGQVVVTGKDGKIQRIPLASVVRMTIAQ